MTETIGLCLIFKSISLLDLNEGVKGLLLVVLRDDFCQEGVLALGQLDEGTDTVDVRVNLDVQNIILS